MNYCVFNAALYGPTSRWSMTHYPRASVERSPHHIALGQNQLRWSNDSLRVDLHDRTAPLRRRFDGQITLHPEHVFSRPVALDRAGAHRWYPTAPLSRAEVVLSRPNLRFTGSAYHDANAGDLALEKTFRSWNWSRTPLGESARILYDVVERDASGAQWGAKFYKNGTVEATDPSKKINLPTTGGWRIPRQTRAEKTDQISVAQTLEDTPFYSRSLLDVTSGGVRSHAIHESVLFDRFRHPMVQCLLPFRMRGGWRR